MSNDFLKNTVSILPDKPGVYKYFDKNKQIIYIGKAKNLKKRVSSYFNKKKQENRKTALMVSKIQHIEFTVVETEYDALLLENTLIKTHKPRYNINLKDDKSYPFIAITNDRFPKVYPIRNPQKNGFEYFGPYSSVRIMHVVLDLIKKLYPIRTCQYVLSQANIASGKFRLCLEYDIGNCKGPCAGLQSEEEYLDHIKQIRYLLKGNLSEVKRLLKDEMSKAVDILQFEKAHDLKGKLEAVENYQSKSTVVNPSLGDLEVFTMTKDAQKAFVNYLRVNEGMVIQSKNMMMVLPEESTENEQIILSAFADIRNNGITSAPEILLPFPIDIVDATFKITVPQMGDKRKLLELSLKNALYFKKEKILMQEKTDPEFRTNRLLEQIKTDINLTELPRHMECFDNSNLQGTNPVSACVVFMNGKPSKKDYRLFNIKTVEGPDDFASMYEVIYRRYSRLLKENQPLPQLVIIDGGKGQLSSSVNALKDLGIYGKLAIIGIAKRLEELYFPHDRHPLYLDKKSVTLRVIQQMRDEAHRFGLSHHRNRRSKEALKSVLEQIPGVGKKTAVLLLNQYASVHKIQDAGEEDISQWVGMKKAQVIMNYLQHLEQQDNPPLS
jgi:excinuclease ABC subunit C